MSTYVSVVTIVHVLISLAGIGAGFYVIWGFYQRKQLETWNAAFLATTVATSATGFLFPVDRFMPSHAIAILSLLVLALAYVARYTRMQTNGWRVTYVLSAIAAQYLNFFVLVVQSFMKVPGLHSLAPTQTEPAFVATHAITLLAFVLLAAVSVYRQRSWAAAS